MFILVLVCLGLPAFILLFTFFSLPYTILAAGGLVLLTCCLYCTWIKDKASKQLHLCNKKSLLLISIVAILVFSAIVFPFNVYDWNKHYALFNLLVDSDWPPIFSLHGDSYLLRYGLGWYMLPALLMKLVGMQFVGLITSIWTTVCLFLILCLAFENIKKASHLFISVLVFFLFSGLDLIGYWGFSNLDLPLFPDWLQWWAGWWQISPNMFGVTWVPQHALAGWAGAVLFFCQRRLALQYAVVIFVFVALWSPLAAVGLVPIALWALDQEGFKICLTPGNFLAVPLLALPALLYLTMSIGSMPGAGLFLIHAGYLDFAVFWLLEFLLVAIIILLAKPTNISLIAIITVFLACASLVQIDVPKNLLMRSAMPSICLLALLAAQALLASRGWRRYLLATYLVIAAVPVVVATFEGMSPTRLRANPAITFDQTIDAQADNIQRYAVPLSNLHDFYQHLVRQR